MKPQPLGYYVVGTTNAKNSTTMLRFAHENGGTADLPKIIFLEHATKEFGIARYQKVHLPIFHEVLLAWDNYRIDANLQWSDMWMFKADISGFFNQLH